LTQKVSLQNVINLFFINSLFFFIDRKWDCIHVGACCPEYRLEYLFDLLKPGGRIVVSKLQK